MPRYAANLSMLYTELPFLDRFAAAAEDGFEGVEYVSPYEAPKEDVAAALKGAGLTQALFNLPAGDWAGGERGIGALPGREAEFREGVDRAIDYAGALGCTQLNCLAGIVPEGTAPEHAEAVLAENLAHAAPRLEAAGIRLLVEPINHFDIPGFALTGADQTIALLDRVGHTNLWLQYDFYHMQRMQGELAATFERLMPRIAHVQIADNPGRHEPGTGEINYPYLLRTLDRLGYAGWVGCEYLPREGTRAGLGWRAEMKGEQA